MRPANERPMNYALVSRLAFARRDICGTCVISQPTKPSGCLSRESRICSHYGNSCICRLIGVLVQSSRIGSKESLCSMAVRDSSSNSPQVGQTNRRDRHADSDRRAISSICGITDARKTPQGNRMSRQHGVSTAAAQRRKKEMQCCVPTNSEYRLRYVSVTA